MIRLEDIKKFYALGDNIVKALDGVNLEINRGDYLAIMGPSGSGKSTLLHILGGLDVPTSGAYFLEEVDISHLSDREIARIRNEHFGFIFQSYNLLPELTAIENAEIPMVYNKTPLKERRARAEFLMDKVGLSHRLKHYPSQMSGGEQQRVAIARALANDPTLILADEPTGNLPSEQGDEIMEMIRQLNDEGTTIVVVTHDPKIGANAKKLVRLCDGKIVYEDDITERFSSEYVSQIAAQTL
ncbi:MAG: ABC transporter ATP-binding protein [Firmicutes bacterium]|nr:ABC transporter ATP-binding protein [Bacillota bacterium]MDD4264372.1 ABC transporter ATP-binding protein [Bacillota bacterium]MDD4693884.1 ABC transporter ATP-binding protein [Bacillota bacterium]